MAQLEATDELHCMLDNFVALVKVGDTDVLNAFTAHFDDFLPKLYRSIGADKNPENAEAEAVSYGEMLCIT